MKKYIKIIILIVIIIICCVFLKNKMFEERIQKVNTNINTSEFVGHAEIKNEIEKALNKSKLLLETQNDFYVYFKVEYINRNMPNKDNIVLVNNINENDYSLIDIYNPKGELLNEFPRDVIKESDENNINIEPNKESLIKLYSNEDNVTYYYIIKISEKGEYTLKEVCYTVGENDDSKIIWNDEDLNFSNQ